MKNFLITILSLLPIMAFSQEVLVDDYDMTFNESDSSWVIKRTLISTTAITGLNDTSYTYTQVADSAAAVRNIFVRSYNSMQEMTAPLNNSFASKRIAQFANQVDTYLTGISGKGYFEQLTEQMGSYYKGRWRILLDTTDMLVDIVDHPTNPSLLQVTEVDGPGTWNARIYTSDKLFVILNFQGELRAMLHNEVDFPERTVFQSLGAIVPEAVGGPAASEIMSMVKIEQD